MGGLHLRRKLWLLFVFVQPINDSFVFSNYLGIMGQLATIVLVFLFVLDVLNSMVTGRFDWFKGRTNKIIWLVFVVLAICSIMLSLKVPMASYKGQVPLDKSLKQVFNLLLWVFTFIYAQKFNHSAQDIISSLKTLIWGFIVAAIIGVIDFLGGWLNIHALVTISTLFHSPNDAVTYNIYGGLVGLPRFRMASSEAFQGALVINGVLPFLWMMSRITKQKAYWWLSLMSIVLLALTFSRAGYSIFLALVLAHLVVTGGPALKKQVAIIFGGIMGLVLIGPFLYQSLIAHNFESDRTRLDMFLISLQIFLHHPLFGVGVGNSGFYYPSYLERLSHPDLEEIYYLDGNLNIYWPDPSALVPRMFAETGLIGTVPVVTNLIKFVVTNFKSGNLRINILRRSLFLSSLFMLFQMMSGMSGLQLLVVPLVFGLYTAHKNIGFNDGFYFPHITPNEYRSVNTVESVVNL